MRRFLDTDILVYADDLNAPEKRERALAILEASLREATGVVSTQVLKEFYVSATDKLGVDPGVARRKVELIASLDIVQVDLKIVLAAIDLSRLHAISFWDALIVRSAATAGCPVLLSEDLQHGQVLDGVRIENPFR